MPLIKRCCGSLVRCKCYLKKPRCRCRCCGCYKIKIVSSRGNKT